MVGRPQDHNFLDEYGFDVRLRTLHVIVNGDELTKSLASKVRLHTERKIQCQECFTTTTPMPLDKMKKKLIKALHDIDIVEI